MCAEVLVLVKVGVWWRVHGTLTGVIRERSCTHFFVTRFCGFETDFVYLMSRNAGWDVAPADRAPLFLAAEARVRTAAVDGPVAQLDRATAF